MNRRLVGVLIVVVALLAIVPLLPAWLPVALSAMRRIDIHDALQSLAASPAALRDLGVRLPWLFPAIGGAATMLAVSAMLRLFARRRQHRPSVDEFVPMKARSGPVSVIPETVEPRVAASAMPVAAETKAPVKAAPVAQPAPVADTRFARPAGERPKPAPTRVVETTSGRRTTVRRLFAAGRSDAEIARETGIGQDGVRGLREMMGAAG